MQGESVVERAISLYHKKMVQVKTVSPEGFHAVFKYKNGNEKKFFDVSTPWEDIPEEERSEFLAAVISLLSLKNSSRKKSFQKILSNSGYGELPFSLEGFDFFDSTSQDFLLQSYSNFELYGLLSSKMTPLEKHGFDAYLYVNHVLKIYGPYNVEVACEAMDAMVNRIKSALNEKLKILARPPRPQLLGEYQVSSSQKRMSPYTVALFSASGIDGSCNCHDFSKNTLRFCKHLACIYFFFGSRPTLQKRLARGVC